MNRERVEYIDIRQDATQTFCACAKDACPVIAERSFTTWRSEGLHPGRETCYRVTEAVLSETERLGKDPWQQCGGQHLLVALLCCRRLLEAAREDVAAVCLRQFQRENPTNRRSAIARSRQENRYETGPQV